MTDYDSMIELYDRIGMDYDTDRAADGFIAPHWVKRVVVIGSVLLGFTAKGRYCGRMDRDTGVFYKKQRRKR